MTKTQKLFIALLALLLIAALVEVGVLIWPDVSNSFFPSTEVAIVIQASNTEISYPVASSTDQPTPTEQPTPTIRIKKPTWTPYPSITPWPSPAPLSTKVPTSIIAPASTTIPNVILVVPTPISAKPDCSAQYNYIESVHQYELDYINAVYNQQLSYYQSLQEQALRERDARMIIQIGQYINQINANRASSINTENVRYQTDKAYLDSECG
jgi:hypothetical protein